MSDGFYRTFEERYYAPRDVITALRKQYLPFVAPLSGLYPGAKTFDIGCGRGEWLELMNGMGFDAYGVDLDDGMLRDCHVRGLQVEKGDAVAYLREMESESHAVVSAFHVVEHISFEDLVVAVQETLRILKPGGLLIMETPNPENFIVATRNFYLDPTHRRPIPSQLLSFLVEYYGFSRIKTIRLQEHIELHKQQKPSLLDVLGGVSPDYAVVAQKSASSDTFCLFDQAFMKDYGLTLDELAVRYDQRVAQGERAEETVERIRNTRTWRMFRLLISNIRELKKRLKLWQS